MAAVTGPRGPLRATVTAPPAVGSRALRVRFDGGARDAPAFLPASLALVLAVGDRVYVDMVGRRPVVRGGI